ncbi:MULTISPECIES: hypothetical protein [unclassified Mesorhizobium]|uniref:hypothetical protein n=1 Tax=unclassified Mesorhizobium TaxID=325217 RepID=UPI0011260B4D|nr:MULTISPECIES: hypothetical protein [unclassified Mesorhizobium]TPK96545.1 hypothetical protein FJ567_21030 [Mesorhizobium sp. B2-4-16]TPL62430.1 hypothetical protein FJ956_25105 [Mesorhizobium sp. B2-4-3]
MADTLAPQITDEELQLLRQRGRVLLLLDAAERASVAPLSTDRLHALAYLADVLSPVWHLPAFDQVVMKSSGGPFFPELQREMDRLVAAGLLEVSNIRYVPRPRGGARIEGCYGLRFGSPHLEDLLGRLGARGSDAALDPRDVQIHAFLIELAGALARLPGDELSRAATSDVTYSDRRVDNNNLIYITPASMPNRSVETAERFATFIPEGASLSPGEKLYLYATYLGRRVHGG